MTDYGVKISKPGYDVKTAGLSNQVFNSERNCIKLDKSQSGSFSRTVGAGFSETVTISHSFGFSPAFLVWIRIDGEWYFQYVGSQAVDFFNCITYSNNSDLNIDLVNNGSSSKLVYIYYILLADKAGS